MDSSPHWENGISIEKISRLVKRLRSNYNSEWIHYGVIDREKKTTRSHHCTSANRNRTQYDAYCSSQHLLLAKRLVQYGDYSGSVRVESLEKFEACFLPFGIKLERDGECFFQRRIGPRPVITDWCQPETRRRQKPLLSPFHRVECKNHVAK